MLKVDPISGLEGVPVSVKLVGRVTDPPPIETATRGEEVLG
jgi:hypothetical protein